MRCRHFTYCISNLTLNCWCATDQGFFDYVRLTGILLRKLGSCKFSSYRIFHIVRKQTLIYNAKNTNGSWYDYQGFLSSWVVIRCYLIPFSNWLSVAYCLSEGTVAPKKTLLGEFHNGNEFGRESTLFFCNRQWVEYSEYVTSPACRCITLIRTNSILL